MSGLCKDCRWWERRRLSKEWRACVLTRTHDYEEVHPTSRATASVTLVDAWEVGSEHAVLLTAPDFGCNQWQPRGSILDAFAELRDAINGAFDGVDADAYVRALRDDDAPPYVMPDGRVIG